MRVILRRLSIKVFFLVGLAALPTPLWADVLNLRSDVLVAQAAFFTPVSTETGCLFTLVDVQVLDDFTEIVNQRPAPGKPQRSNEPEDSLTIRVFDTCTYQDISLFFCLSGDTSDSHIKENLGSATLATTMSCTDSYAPEAPAFEVPVDITWSATGEISKRFIRQQESNPIEKGHAIFRSSSRTAVASGTVLMGGTNLIPNESEYADLLKQSRATHVLLNCMLYPEFCEIPPVGR